MPAPIAGVSRAALVSGASFAGLATAFWLHRLGYRVTLVELAPGLRRDGVAVNLVGEAVDVLARMGLIEAVRTRALPPRRHAFKRPDGSLLACTPPDSGGDAQEYEIHRGDLLSLLADALDGSIELLFGRSITRLHEGADAVAATLSDGTSRDFALVFGCDGNRSNTRRLVFGDGERFSFFMGGYHCVTVVRDIGLVPADTSEVVSLAGRFAMLNGYEDRTDIVFGFRTDGQIEYDHRDKRRLRQLVHRHFDDMPWKVPDMLAKLDRNDDFYFDRLTQIRMPSWSRGRVGLVGDAGYCVSPFAGFGASMAIIGAGRLAGAFTRHPDDHEAGFREYENGLRPFVEEVQERAATDGVPMMFPATSAALAERDRRMLEGDFGPPPSTPASLDAAQA